MIKMEPQVKLISITANADELIERAGRICYNSESNPETREKFIQSALRKEHHSILEHCSASFELIVSRNAHVQLVRHRLASFSVQSQRWVKYQGEPEMIVCNELGLEEKGWLIAESLQQFRKYGEAIERGIKPEDARNLLPGYAATPLVFSANFRELLRIMYFRLDVHAQFEIRILFEKILAELKKHSVVFREPIAVVGGKVAENYEWVEK